MDKHQGWKEALFVSDGCGRQGQPNQSSDSKGPGLDWVGLVTMIAPRCA